MKIGRVKVVLIDQVGTVAKMRTAFEHNAAGIAAEWAKEYGTDAYVIDSDGDYVLFLPKPEADLPAAPLEEQVRAGRKNRS